MTPVADDDVTVRPDLRLLRVKRSDSDSSPECTGELERDAVVAPLPRRALRLPARTNTLLRRLDFITYQIAHTNAGIIKTKFRRNVTNM